MWKESEYLLFCCEYHNKQSCEVGRGVLQVHAFHVCPEEKTELGEASILEVVQSMLPKVQTHPVSIQPPHAAQSAIIYHNSCFDHHSYRQLSSPATYANTTHYTANLPTCPPPTSTSA